MKFARNKMMKTRAILICKSEEDAEALSEFYHNGIIFGLYQIWINNPEGKGRNLPQVKAILDKVPDCKAIGWISIVKGFVPIQEIKQLHNQKET